MGACPAFIAEGHQVSAPQLTPVLQRSWYQAFKRAHNVRSLVTNYKRGVDRKLLTHHVYRICLAHFRRRQSRRDGGTRTAARYFGGQAQSANGEGHHARVQLWKSDKRRDHAISWMRAVASLEPSAEAGAVPIPTTAGHQKQRTSIDFLPVDPVLSLDENPMRSGPTAERDGEDTENLEQWVARRTKEFNVKTREHPNCEEIWLQFVDFQEEAVRALHGSGEKQARRLR